MTALPLRDFSAAEQDKLAAIEAAPAAPESVRERLARALVGFVPPISFNMGLALARDAADAALAVLRGPSSDAERAVERCLALADRLNVEAPDREAWDGNEQALMREVAARIRAVLAGD